MSKYLINNADDFGYSDDINEAIYKSFHEGVLSSASVLINCLPSKKSSNCPLGLHLNLATGKPVSQKWRKALGGFYQPKRNANEKFNLEDWLGVTGNYDKQLIREEFLSQLNLFFQIYNKMPTHLDTHYNTIIFDNVFAEIVRLAGQTGIPIRQPVGFKSGEKLATSELFTDEGKMQIVKTNKLPTTDKFCYEYLNRHVDYLKVVEMELDKLLEGEVLEIVYHPGFTDVWRKQYTDILCDPAFRTLLNKKKVVLVNYDYLRFRRLQG